MRIFSGQELLISKFAAFVLVILISMMAGEALAEVSIVHSLRIHDQSDRTRLVFDLSSVVKRRVFLLSNPQRIVVDLEDARMKSIVEQPSSAHPLFKAIRHAPRNGNDLRVVLDLKKKVKSESFILTPIHGHGYRLVLDLYDVTFVEAGSAKNAGKGVGKAPRKVESVASRQPTVVRISEADDEFVVAIDAGHGGSDPGALGKHGTREKDVVLKIAKQLHKIIASEPGMRPVLIRKGDYYVGLRQRIKIARKAEADIFISIHADAAPQSSVRGSSIYTLSKKGASSEAARWLATRENKSDLVGGVSLDDQDEMVAEVLLDLSQTATQNLSSDAASKVLASLSHLGKVRRKKVQSAGFVVLKSPDIPSILVETAFISNPSEEKKLKSGSYQKKLARAIFKGIRRYYTASVAPSMHATSQRHVVAKGETLSELASMYGVSTRRLQTTNSLDTTRIRSGQVLEIPASRRHVIVKGETLSEIASIYGVSTRRLQVTNSLDTTRIRSGQVLEIPTGS